MKMGLIVPFIIFQIYLLFDKAQRKTLIKIWKSHWENFPGHLSPKWYRSVPKVFGLVKLVKLFVIICHQLCSNKINVLTSIQKSSRCAIKNILGSKSRARPSAHGSLPEVVSSYSILYPEIAMGDGAKNFTTLFEWSCLIQIRKVFTILNCILISRFHQF